MISKFFDAIDDSMTAGFDGLDNIQIRASHIVEAILGIILCVFLFPILLPVGIYGYIRLRRQRHAAKLWREALRRDC